jgi:hypothetical protein
MKPYACKFLAAFTFTALGLTLTGCQQAPPPAASQAAPAAPAQATAAPTSATESSSSSRSVEVKSNPVGSVEKSVTKESTTTKQQQ